MTNLRIPEEEAEATGPNDADRASGPKMRGNVRGEEALRGPVLHGDPAQAAIPSCHP